MRLRTILTAFFALSAALAPADGAPRGADADQWVRVPAEYAHFKLRRFTTKVPPAEYRAVVDVPARGRGGPAIARSSGDAAVDEIAREFAASYATHGEKLRALHAAKELRFSLLLDLRNDPDMGWRTPTPRSPLSLYTSTVARSSNAAVRVTTGADGRVKSARIVGTLGSSRYDREVEEFIRQNWSGPPNTTRILEAP